MHPSLRRPATILRLAVAGLALLLSSRAADAQDPPRPPLPAGADTNDWEPYYDLGVSLLRKNTREADAAFYWSSRLDPSRAEAPYARWVAFWIGDDKRFGRYLRGDSKVLASSDVQRADALRDLAVRRNPFVHQGLYLVILDAMPGRFRTDEATRGWIAYANGNLPEAVRLFGRAVERDSAKWAHLRYLRASAFVGQGAFADAAAELAAYLDHLRASDQAVTVNAYQSKALLEYGLGLLHLRRRDRAAAEAAFGRALLEDLAFVPAHLMIGRQALADRKPEEAVRAFTLALEADSGDVMVRIAMGDALQAQGRSAVAVEHYQHAMLAERYYADLAFKLGVALEGAGRPAEAAAAYRHALGVASRRWPLASRARARVAALPAGGRASP